MAKQKDLIGEDEDFDTPSIGHNSQPAAQQLRSILERIERLEEEKKGLSADIREIYTEAKGNRFDPKTLRQILKLRRISVADRREQQHLLDTYLSALGEL